MKIVLFSDTHLTKRLEKDKFNFLKKIISKADRVIILGDFWDGGLVSLDDFINSPWNKLFPLFKKKHTVFVPGNHEKEKIPDKRFSLFSDIQTNKYRFTLNKQTFVVEHGDRFFRNDFLIYFTYGGPFRDLYLNKLVTGLYSITEEVLVKNFGTKFLERFFKKRNIKIKKIIKKELIKGEILICGHTHGSELDLKSNFINTGLIRHGLGQYVIIDGDRIFLKEEWYEINSKLQGK